MQPDPHGKTDWKKLAEVCPTFFLDLPVVEGVRELWEMVPVERRREKNIVFTEKEKDRMVQGRWRL